MTTICKNVDADCHYHYFESVNQNLNLLLANALLTSAAVGF
jgi:hypothetical protein